MKLGPNAEFSSRFFANATDFSNVVHPFEREQLDPQAFKRILEELSENQYTHGQIGKMRNLAQQNGIKLPVSVD